MAKSKAMGRKQKKKKVIVSQQSLDDLDESLLLGGDDPEPRDRRISLDASILEAELLGEDPIVPVIKKSKRRKTSTKSKSELDISLNVQQDEANNVLETPAPTAAECKAKNTSQPKPHKSKSLKRKKMSILETIDSEVAKLDKPSNVNKSADDSESTTKAVTQNTESVTTSTAESVTAPTVESVTTPTPESVTAPTTESAAVKSGSPENPSSPTPEEKDTTDNKGTEIIQQEDVEKPVEEDEVDIYSDLSNDNVDTHTPEGDGEVTMDEVFKMNSKVSPPVDKQPEKDKLLSGNEEEDLDYEEEEEKEASQMKISVLVGGTKNDKSSSRNKQSTPHNKPSAIILPPLPHSHISIPPMLPLPPVLPRPPAPQYFPSSVANSNKRMIYINPKFKTEVIIKNLELQGIIKGGTVAIHMNRKLQRSRSRSPIKCHNFEYVPSPIAKKVSIELDDPTTTLLITDLSACTTRSRIKELFSSIGNVKEVLTYPKERRAVVTFESAKDAVVCRRKFHRSMVDGSYMTVNFAI